MGFTSRVDVLSKLRNQTLRITGLRSVFNGWPFATNPAVEQVRDDVESWLDSLHSQHPKLRKLKAGDYGLFGAAWFPFASLERLRIGTYLCIWLFIWDDEIDSDVGSLAANFALAQEFRSETLRYIKNRLGLDTSAEFLKTSDPVIKSFDIIGDALRESYTREQREIFMNEIDFFMDKSEVEHRLRMSEHVVSLEEYWHYRLGTSAVRVVLAVSEFGNDTNLPPYVMQDEDMATLWDLTNANICIVNDLLSVKKEIAQGSAESLVPILFAQLRSAQAAVDQVMETVRLTVEEFDVVAYRLLQRYSTDPIIVAPLQSFVDTCRYFCTGNLSWRYG
ncbi:hypothetical protein MMC34_004653 [Xylographa carneopallida]|nr:hypothetical protein [Xylographa carneopallida]